MYVKDRFNSQRPIEPPSCTCAGCPFERTCEFAWDTYNTNGDCLADK